MIAIPDMKPRWCSECPMWSDTRGCHIGADDYDDCPLIEIVRCGECKWGNKDNEGTLWCEHAIGGIMKPADFCSCGERRADERTTE